MIHPAPCAIQPSTLDDPPGTLDDPPGTLRDPTQHLAQSIRHVARSPGPLRHSFFASPRPLVFAHRGGAALAPENTIAAFDNGLRLGADGLELDVRFSQDGVVVVHHDLTLDRTTDRRGEVAAFTSHDLARVDAGHRFGAGDDHPFRGHGVGVPTLADVLARYRDCRIIAEMKLDTAEFAAAVVAVVRAAGAVDRVCLGSFGRKALRAARAMEPALATSAAREEVRWALYRSWCRWPVMRVGYAGYQVPERAEATRIVSPRFVRDAHAAGLGVQVWTVNTEPDAQRLIGWGVDGLITDRPDLLAIRGQEGREGRERHERPTPG
jgi:glycerophosphoryl diester phosphodiesterase